MSQAIVKFFAVFILLRSYHWTVIKHSIVFDRWRFFTDTSYKNLFIFVKCKISEVGWLLSTVDTYFISLAYFFFSRIFITLLSKYSPATHICIYTETLSSDEFWEKCGSSTPLLPKKSKSNVKKSLTCYFWIVKHNEACISVT